MTFIQKALKHGSRIATKNIRLAAFSNLTQNTTELSKNILDSSNIIIEAINKMNRNTNIIYQEIIIYECNVYSVTTKLCQSSSRRVPSFKDSSALLNR